MPITIKKLVKTDGLKKIMDKEGYPTDINIPDIGTNISERESTVNNILGLST